MAIQTQILYERVDNLYLDPRNPRLGAEKVESGLDPENLLNEMRDWELEELAVSFLESNFWPQEALLVVKERLNGQIRNVVVEGNRRLAALKYLKRSFDGKPPTKKWAELVAGKKCNEDLFSKIPYIVSDSREEITGYLGFRHVSGIKEWDPPEKAAFIAYMIDVQKLSYEQVMRRIGSKTEPVRRNYIAHRLLLQMQEIDGDIDTNRVQQRFSLLFLAIRSSGVQNYLGIDIEASPKQAKVPVKKDKIKELTNFAIWLFGSDLGKNPVEPIVTDSRNIEKFSKALANVEARSYMERTKEPDLFVAYRMAGGEEYETYEELETVVTILRSALGVIHTFRRVKRIEEVVVKVTRASLELLRGYPELRADILAEEESYSRPVRARK